MRLAKKAAVAAVKSLDDPVVYGHVICAAMAEIANYSVMHGGQVEGLATFDGVKFSITGTGHCDRENISLTMGGELFEYCRNSQIITKPHSRELLTADERATLMIVGAQRLGSYEAARVPESLMKVMAGELAGLFQTIFKAPQVAPEKKTFIGVVLKHHEAVREEMLTLLK